MTDVVPLKGNKSGYGNQGGGEGMWWKRRLAAQVMAQLPDNVQDAIDVLEEAKELILLPRSRPV